MKTNAEIARVVPTSTSTISRLASGSMVDVSFGIGRRLFNLAGLGIDGGDELSPSSGDDTSPGE